MERITTDRELLEALDPEHPGLEEVRAALETGNLDTAREQFVLYLRDAKKQEIIDRQSMTDPITA